MTDGEAGLWLDPRDMLKIGYLYLHDGMWDGQQIIPASWVAYAEAGKWVLTTNNGKLGAMTHYFPGPLGLDGRLRLAAPQCFGIAADRGRWLSESSLEVERRILGSGATQRWILTFDGNDVSVHFADTDGEKADVHGRAN